MAGIPFGGRSASHQLGLMNASEKCLDGRQRDLDHFTGNKTMRFAMYTLRGFGIRRIDQTERGSAPLVIPVGEELHPIPILNRQIPAMRLGDVFSGCPRKIMPVHEDSHVRASFGEPLSISCMLRRCNL